ncbi:MAG: glycoside hydrolase domain-containing protein, partial [Cellulomonadaceae bacterium]
MRHRPLSPQPGHRRHPWLAAAAALSVLATGSLIAPGATAAPEAAASDLAPFDAVNQFIGTGFDPQNNKRGNDHYGNTFPGATLPFGMVQSSPTTYRSTDGEQFGGYEYSADQIRGFGMTRLSGTGCRPRYSGFDFPVLPHTDALGDEGVLTKNPADDITQFFLGFDHEDETAEPGYYQVGLDNGVDVELTSTTRAAVSSFDFPDDSPATLLFNAAGSNNDLTESAIDVDPETGTVTGTVTAKIVCASGPSYTAHFSASFDQEIESYGTWTADGVEAGRASASATTAKNGSGAWVTFADGADVTATVGLSYVSVDGAAANAGAEVGSQGFAEVRADARATWEEALGTIDATGGTEDERVKLYTALYHALGHPNVFQDADGTYIGYDGEQHEVRPGHDFYVNFSGWDTYRGQAQLVALLFPDVASDINQSIVDMVEQSGRWTSWPSYNQIQTKMSGDSLQVIVAATDDFGATDYDREDALASMVESQTLPMTASNRSDGF